MLSNTGHYTMHVIVIAVVLIGSAVWLPVAFFAQSMSPPLRIAVGIIGFLAIIAMFNRDLYLPFLASTVIPSSIIPLTATKTTLNPEDIVVQISGLPSNAKVVYWAATNGDPRTKEHVTAVKDAYGSYENSGVVVSDGIGVATCTIQCPQQYQVKHMAVWKKLLPKHIHYRFALGNGMWSRVMTQEINTCNNKGIQNKKPSVTLTTSS